MWDSSREFSKAEKLRLEKKDSRFSFKHKDKNTLIIRYSL